MCSSDLLLGAVSSVDATRALLVIGNTVVDYSSQLSLKPGLEPQAGALYEAVGIQPEVGGAILVGLQYDGAVLTVSSRP